MVVRFPCKICNKTVSYGSDSIQCDKCDIWVHRQCNGLNKQTFEYLKKDKSNWFCMVCTKEFLPFFNLDDKNLILTVKGKKMKFTNVAEKRVSNKTKVLDRINLRTRCEDNNITKYFQSDELRNLPQPSCIEKEYLKAFHLNISSLPYHCSELHSLLSNCRINFDIIGITESRLKRNQKALQNIDIPNYNIEHCPTEGPNGGALIYVKNDIIYKVRNDLKIYQSEKLESVFIEIIKSNNRNIIVGCVYRHPSMEVNEFNSLFLNTLSENLLSEKNKEIVLLGDFNIDLLKYEKDHNISDFLDQMYSASLVPHITFPTRVTSLKNSNR